MPEPKVTRFWFLDIAYDSAFYCLTLREDSKASFYFGLTFRLYDPALVFTAGNFCAGRRAE